MRLMVLKVRGGELPPLTRLVSVEDDIEFIGYMRIWALRQIIQKAPNGELHEELLRSLHVSLKDTGLVEYPETEHEVEDLLRRFS